MKIYSVTDPEFKPYGNVIEGCPVGEILKVLREQTPVPEGVVYVPDFDPIRSLDEAKRLSVTVFGGVPAQFGYCNGHNTTLNCLEYHRCSEFNLGTEDFILLLAKQDEIEDGILDTAKVKAFRVPAGVLIEVYATSLHYAPCQAFPDKGFQVLVVLSEGTNLDIDMKTYAPLQPEEEFLTATNKWLLPHPDSPEAKGGAKVGLKGVNIDIADSL